MAHRGGRRTARVEVHLPAPLRRALVVAAAVAGLVILYLAVTFARVVSMGSQHARAEADVIVVMGAAQYDGKPSEMLTRRLRTALELWDAGLAEWVAVTGGNRAGDRFTEAGTSAAWLAERGVPESRILREETGRSTWESLSGLERVLHDNKVESALVVTTDWHEARAVFSMRELGFRAEPASAGSAQGSVVRWLRETVAVGIGRVIGFGRLFSLTG